MNKTRRKICVVLVDRANYGRLKPVMMAIRDHEDLELQCIAAGTMVLERFGRPVELVRSHGLPIAGEIYTELEGSTPSSMAKSVGFATVEFSSEFQRLKPDVVLLIGDRYEALAAALAAAYMNLCIVHIQGGEVSGSIDESARHAITKFAHFHFPATQRSALYLERMGEAPENILGIGCPSSDLARTLDRHLPEEILNGTGSGAYINPEKPFLLTLFHPVTTAYGDEQEQMWHLLRALERHKMPTVLLWPNIDAGSDHISKAIRVFRDQTAPDWLRTITNLNPENYLKVLARTACAVGNSSSFVRDAGYFGTPVVLAGARQEGREVGDHVMPTIPREEDIDSAIRAQLTHGRYDPCTLYGDGYVADRIASALATLKPYRQKRLHYIYDSDTNDASSSDRDGSGRLEGDTAKKSGSPRRKAVVGLHG